MMKNPAKVALRKKIAAVLDGMTTEGRKRQSQSIFNKIVQHSAFKSANRVSVYLSTEAEVDTVELLKEMFKLKKQVFVPTYGKKGMEMVKLQDFADYESLPLTKWNIKQPPIDNREIALETGGLDLVLLPGVAFTKENGRCGHGMGYYDKYLHRLCDTPEKRKKVSLIALAFHEQIVDVADLPLDSTDVILDEIVTAD